MKFKEIPDFEAFESSLSERNILHNLQIFGAHEDLRDRLKKTLYYGRLPKSPRTSLPLTEATVELFSKAVPKGKLDILDSDFAASVSRKASISPCSLMLALVYLDRLRHKNPEYLQSVSSCDLFLVSMMVASKYLFDDGEEEEVFNDEWAAAANMETKDLNSLEREFLSAMGWELFVKPENFFQMLQELESRVAFSESSKRGWLTYSDINVMAKKALLLQCWNILLEDVIKVILVSTIAYVSAVATLATASTLSRQCCIFITQSLPASHICTNNTLFPPNKQFPSHTRDAFFMDPQSIEERWNSMPNKPSFIIPCNNHSLDSTQQYWFRENDHLSDCERPASKASTIVNEIILISLEKVKTVFEGITINRGQKDKLSFWSSLQYWPTCCGGVNSYFL